MPPINDAASKPVAVHGAGVPAVVALLEGWPVECSVEITTGALLVTTVAAVGLDTVVVSVVCPAVTADTFVMVTVTAD
jgi:hypothetical protein